MSRSPNGKGLDRRKVYMLSEKPRGGTERFQVRSQMGQKITLGFKES